MAANKIHINLLNWRYLFWSEHDETGKIERATLAGEERETIVTGAVWIPDMAVDTDSQTIYWIDIQRNTVEKCDYNGNNRKVVRRSKFTSITMSGITVFKVIAIKSCWDSCIIFTFTHLHIKLYINNIIFISLGTAMINLTNTEQCYLEYCIICMNDKFSNNTISNWSYS